MKKCRFCGEDLDSSYQRRGFCDECYSLLLETPERFKSEVLDYIEVPMMVINVDDTTIRTANDKLLKFVEKSLDQVTGFLGGDVIECIHAKEDGGCGGTIFCNDCPIRNLINKTIKTKEDQKHKTLIQSIKKNGDIIKIELEVSTKLKNDVVFLQIENYKTLL